MVTEARRPPLPALPRVHVMGVLGTLFVALIVVWLAKNAYETPALFYENFLIGLTQGAVYGLVALGYTLVYGILELINFGHCDVFMLGGMMAAAFAIIVFALADHSGATLWLLVILTLLVCMAFCGTLNASIELVAYRRLRNAPRLAPLIT